MSRWIVRTRKEHEPNNQQDPSNEAIIINSMSQTLRFESVKAFLLGIGVDFAEFGANGLKQFQIPYNRVVDIIEDAAEGDDLVERN